MALQDDLQELSEVVRELIREMKVEREQKEIERLKTENKYLQDYIARLNFPSVLLKK